MIQETKRKIHDIVEKYEANKNFYRTSKFNETQVRNEFLDPLFEAFGWDIRNTAGKSTNEREVLLEEPLKANAASHTKKPDYTFRLRDVLDNRAMNEHIAPAINKLKSMVKDIGRLIDFNDGDIWKNNNIVVINLNDVNQDSKKMIPLLLCMTIASQRPSDISSTIVSQLHNYFIHRLVNDEDIEKVGQTISFLDRISKESLPILSTGVCVIAGQLVEMPVVVQIDQIENANKPNNETIDVVSKWS